MKILDTDRDKAFSLGFEGVHELSLLIPSSQGIVVIVEPFCEVKIARALNRS